MSNTIMLATGWRVSGTWIKVFTIDHWESESDTTLDARWKWKYIVDPTPVHKDLTIGVEPVRILDSQVKQLRWKEIQIVKVL